MRAIELLGEPRELVRQNSSEMPGAQCQLPVQALNNSICLQQSAVREFTPSFPQRKNVPHGTHRRRSAKKPTLVIRRRLFAKNPHRWSHWFCSTWNIFRIGSKAETQRPWPDSWPISNTLLCDSG